MVNIIPNITGLHSICTYRQMHAWKNACTHGQEDKALITKNLETMQKYQVKYELNTSIKQDDCNSHHFNNFSFN